MIISNILWSLSAIVKYHIPNEGDDVEYMQKNEFFETSKLREIVEIIFFEKYLFNKEISAAAICFIGNLFKGSNEISQSIVCGRNVQSFFDIYLLLLQQYSNDESSTKFEIVLTISNIFASSSSSSSSEKNIFDTLTSNDKGIDLIKTLLALIAVPPSCSDKRKENSLSRRNQKLIKEESIIALCNLCINIPEKKFEKIKDKFPDFPNEFKKAVVIALSSFFDDGNMGEDKMQLILNLYRKACKLFIW